MSTCLGETRDFTKMGVEKGVLMLFMNMKTNAPVISSYLYVSPKKPFQIDLIQSEI